MIGDRFPVLDKGWVEVRAIMGDDTAIANAARASFLGESKGAEADRRLIRRLMKDGHTSPFEMGEAVIIAHAPLVVWWQWVRHRLFSFSFQSGRYTELGAGRLNTIPQTANGWHCTTPHAKMPAARRRLETP